MTTPKKPEKTETTLYHTSIEVHENRGYNQSCDDWETYLKSLEGEIQEELMKYIPYQKYETQVSQAILRRILNEGEI